MKSQYYYIPDNNLRKALYGFANEDSLLDASKIKGWMESGWGLDLDLSGKGIENLDGLQYFKHNSKHIWTLNISNNKIKELKNLPPNLVNLICTENKIEVINNLPNSLNRLNCSHNLIKEITNLPNSLTSLNFSNNLMKTFPVLPANLGYINYHNNPLNINKLPELYKNAVPCDHPNQNCLPYELLNWKLLNNNIKDTVFKIVEVKVTKNTLHSWGFGEEIRKINFIKEGKKLICKSDSVYRTYGIQNKEPTNENRENEHSINIKELEEFLKNLYNRKMYFEFQIIDSIQTVNLRTKRNGSNFCLPPICHDCSFLSYKYEIYTTKDTISLTYDSDTFDAEICGENGPEDIKSILNLLYVYKLEKIILNREYYNYQLQEIFKWERNYK